MKKFNFFVVFTAVLFSMILFSSCQDEEIKPGIIYTDTPPENLFASNSDYAVADQVWVDINSILNGKDKGQACLYWTDNETGDQTSYDCGKWKILQCKKYWGMLNGIHYISNSMDWYVISPETYSQIRDLVEKRGIMICWIYMNGRTPWGNLPVISGYEE